MPHPPIVLSREEFAARDYSPVEMVLDPWLPTSGIALISGYPGAGKTFVGLASAVAIATGTTAIGWTATSPRSVLYVDGEMDPAETRDRLTAIERSLPPESQALLARNFTILQHADQPDGIPNLSTTAGQNWFAQAVAHDVIFFDNIGTLFRLGDEKEEKDWKPCQEWLVKIRGAGISSVLFHHTGKPHKDPVTGEVTYAQHGTSARERIPNVTGLLVPHKSKAGVFTVRWEKWRGTGGKKRPDPATWEIKWPEPMGQTACEFVPCGSGSVESRRTAKVAARIER